jgi:hypothetical protein
MEPIASSLIVEFRLPSAARPTISLTGSGNDLKKTACAETATLAPRRD